MKNVLFSLLIFLAFSSYCQNPDSTILWHDEFNQNGQVDTSKWYLQHILPNGKTWFSGEIQHYTQRDTNAFVKNGCLHIVAQKETHTQQGVTFNYTSARLNSKFAFTYGRVQVRAKMPTGSGLWTSVWTLGKNIIENGAYWSADYGTMQWPYCGETNILEYWGAIPNKLLGGAHTPDGWGTFAHQGLATVNNAETQFHVYDMIWKPDVLIFLVDGEEYYRYNPQPKNLDNWPFTEPQYLLANIAVRPEIADNFTKTELVIDYIRVYDIDSTTQVNEYPEGLKTFSVFPNPFTQNFEIKNPNNQIKKAELFSPTGKLLETSIAKNEALYFSTNHIKPGIYFVKIYGQNHILTQKVIKY